MLLWLIEETGWRVYYSDSQAFALSLANMERFEFAALYTLPHRLPRNAQSPHGVQDGYVVWRCGVHKSIAQFFRNTNPPWRAWR